MSEKDVDITKPLWPWNNGHGREINIANPIPDGMCVVEAQKIDDYAKLFESNENHNPVMYGDVSKSFRGTGPWLYANGVEAPMMFASDLEEAKSIAIEIMKKRNSAGGGNNSVHNWAMVSNLGGALGIFLRWRQPCFGSVKVYYENEYHPTDINFDFPPGTPEYFVFSLRSVGVQKLFTPGTAGATLKKHIEVLPDDELIVVNSDVDPDIMMYYMRRFRYAGQGPTPFSHKLNGLDKPFDDPIMEAYRKEFLISGVTQQTGYNKSTRKYEALNDSFFVSFPFISTMYNGVNIHNFVTGKTKLPGPRTFRNRDGYVRMYNDELWSQPPTEEGVFALPVNSVTEKQTVEFFHSMMEEVQKGLASV